MPEFKVVPLQEALSRTAFIGRRGQFLQEYLGYIQRLGQGQAGRLQVAGDEKVLTIRRRLALAAQALDVNRSSSGPEMNCISGPNPQQKSGPRAGTPDGGSPRRMPRQKLQLARLNQNSLQWHQLHRLNKFKQQPQPPALIMHI